MTETSLMQHHKLDFRNKNHLEQITMGERLVTAADTLPTEQRQQVVRLDDLRAHTAAARASHLRIATLRAELKSELTNRNTLLGQLRTAATGTAQGIGLVTKHDPAAMQAAGLDLAKTSRTPVGLPDAPTNLRAVPTDNEGEAQLRWKRTIRRCWFDVEWHTDPPDADHWQHEDTSLPQKCRVQGLVSGAKYWFRVRATNAHGASAWSQLASVRVK